ncbi:hypothetical protein EVAR_57427_1 [Eumeta japonica]|uniref:Uncharacterized protein n=1 Tax=Eumeta variegata TaxID=151549 RepID=A0A4C1Y9A7_EUMVA|nr:hypothetical protein EVAR_57427_1 [Eumeta japonica]
MAKTAESNSHKLCLWLFLSAEIITNSAKSSFDFTSLIHHADRRPQFPNYYGRCLAELLLGCYSLTQTLDDGKRGSLRASRGCEGQNWIGQTDRHTSDPIIVPFSHPDRTPKTRGRHLPSIVSNFETKKPIFRFRRVIESRTLPFAHVSTRVQSMKTETEHGQRRPFSCRRPQNFALAEVDPAPTRNLCRAVFNSPGSFDLTKHPPD